ncbi:hypothetical protein [Halarcobacter ebronensis]|nr:hypothetical protein [Halarcobacter ebronensis]
MLFDIPKRIRVNPMVDSEIKGKYFLKIIILTGPGKIKITKEK